MKSGQFSEDMTKTPEVSQETPTLCYISRTEQTEQTEQPQQNLAFSRSVCETGNGTNGTETEQTQTLHQPPKSPTTLPPFAETSQLEWFKCPRCGLRRLLSPDSWLLGGRCPECGADMQPEDPDGNPPTQPTDLAEPDFAPDEPVVDTLQWLAENIGFAPTDTSDQVSAKDQPLESDQTFESVPISAKAQPLESDQPPKGRAVPPLSCREMANELLAILRQFQRSSSTHRKCLTEPCPVCRSKVRKVRWLEREGNRHGLWFMLQRARQWQGGDGLWSK
ncbi:MAG: hypothetical protein N3B10_06395, partial [Armatimonadetes bacterium]|nr:hypothetical protein [Armatimonadota bacterium]